MSRSSRSGSKRRRRNFRNQRALYLPLDSKLHQIRILNISPSLSTGKLVGWFEIISLLDDPHPGLSYEAISWCWGRSRIRKDMLIDDQVTEIPQAADVALRNLCLRHGHLRVWMDAVCINQRDAAERSRQVAIMEKIYSKAERVLVWLGTGDGTTGAAFDSVDRLVAQCYSEIEDKTNIVANFYKGDSAYQYSDRPLPSCQWNAIIGLYSSPWFFRFWVVQEVGLAKAGICYRGHQYRSWTEVSLAAEWLVHRRYSRPEYCGRLVRGIGLASRMWYFTFRNDYSLATLLHRSTSFLTLLPLDKVYGCLGLWKASKHSDASQKAQASLHVDYGRGRDALYATATYAAIREMSGNPRELRLLGVASHLVSEDDEVHSGSSWVPRLDWIFAASRGSPRYVRGFGGGAADSMTHESINSTVGMDNDSEQNFVLSVSGVVVDEASEVSSVIWWTRKRNYDELAKEVYRCREIALRSADERAFALTMTCGKDSKRNFVKNCDSLWGQYTDFLAACTEVVRNQAHSSELEDGHYPENFKEQNTSRHYGDIVFQESYNRRFFVTSTGIIGMGPRTMKESDHVCILLGGVTPFVLRADGDHWKFIGDAYVAGIMEGEYIRRLKTEGSFETKLRRFKIR